MVLQTFNHKIIQHLQNDLFCVKFITDRVTAISLVSSVFTARRLAKHGICRRRVSVCLFVRLCVCVSVTLRYCIKTAKRRITQITLHDSPMTSFLTPKFIAKFERDHPLWGLEMQVGWVKICHFRRKSRYNSKTVQDRHYSFY